MGLFLNEDQSFLFLASAVDGNLQTRAFTHDGAAHAVADLRGVHIELREGAAQRVAMHAKLGRRFALVALVVGQHFENVALLELLDSIRIGDASAVHLGDQGVKFALQRTTSLAYRTSKITTGESPLYTRPTALLYP
jgi:hypothetical protein